MTQLILVVTVLFSLNSHAQMNIPKPCQNLTTSDRNQIGFRCTTERSRPVVKYLWERVFYKNFGQAWQLINEDGSKGPIWSEAFGSAQNIPTVVPHRSDPIDDSEAARICQNAGGRLPSKVDFERIHPFHYFIFDPVREEGMIYPIPGPFWTSTIFEYGYGIRGAYIYYPERLNTQFGWDEFYRALSVICISESN